MIMFREYALPAVILPAEMPVELMQMISSPCSTRSSSYAYVPAEVVLKSPNEPQRPIVMDTARVHVSDLTEHEGRLLNRADKWRAIAPAHSAADWKYLSVIENWEDVGDDGHVEYRFQNYVVTCLTSKELSELTLKKVSAIAWGPRPGHQDDA